MSLQFARGALTPFTASIVWDRDRPSNWGASGAGRETFAKLFPIDQVSLSAKGLFSLPNRTGFIMSSTVRYLTHPQVLREPLKDSRSWSLNSVGATRVARLASRLGTLRLTRHVSSSAETTALDTARPLATALGIDVDIHDNMGEVDRTSTGFLSEREFERTATDFFSRPQKRIRGWEPAYAAQERIMSAVDACLSVRLNGDVLIVGHWSVGTLLFCGLSGQSIDQNLTPDPGGGFWFEFDSQLRLPAGGWRPMEAL